MTEPKRNRTLRNICDLAHRDHHSRKMQNARRRRIYTIQCCCVDGGFTRKLNLPYGPIMVQVPPLLIRTWINDFAKFLPGYNQKNIGTESSHNWHPQKPKYDPASHEYSRSPSRDHRRQSHHRDEPSPSPWSERRSGRLSRSGSQYQQLRFNQWQIEGVSREGSTVPFGHVRQGGVRRETSSPLSRQEIYFWVWRHIVTVKYQTEHWGYQEKRMNSAFADIDCYLEKKDLEFAKVTDLSRCL